MNRKALFLLLIMLVFPLLACQISDNTPQIQNRSIPETTEEIVIPLPDDQTQTTKLKMQFGGGKLTVKPGAEGNLVEGVAVYNYAEFKPVVTTSGDQITLSMSGEEISFPLQVKNLWDLKLASVPLDLEIFAGGYEGSYDFGGLSLKNLRISEGASQTSLSFSSPNNADMETLRFETGASQVKFVGLGNANFQNMIFNSGAGEYGLDFSGDLKHDAQVSIKSGLSSITLIIPQGLPASVKVNGGMMNVDYSREWEFSGGEYILEGTGPTLTFNVEMGAGTLALRVE